MQAKPPTARVLKQRSLRRLGDHCRYSAIMLNMFFGDFKMTTETKTTFEHLVEAGKDYETLTNFIEAVVAELGKSADKVYSLKVEKSHHSISISFRNETENFNLNYDRNSETLELISNRYLGKKWIFNNNGTPTSSTTDETLADIVHLNFGFSLLPQF